MPPKFTAGHGVVIERRLQNPGREVDIVLWRIVVAFTVGGVMPTPLDPPACRTCPDFFFFVHSARSSFLTDRRASPRCWSSPSSGRVANLVGNRIKLLQRLRLVASLIHAASSDPLPSTLQRMHQVFHVGFAVEESSASPSPANRLAQRVIR